VAESLDSPVDYRSKNTKGMVHSALKELNSPLFVWVTKKLIPLYC
ncbi:uncharacterized protein METZ01_LOCUS455613, partial [marine metagenome]